ncbi:hypothetical protein [Streptomyces acidiscabies]|uniref:hypothetical protein n=1 Tax=Streptomyces acidiscabies TaxID=42234 RepID=UPI001180BA34|nr:hypothetical protein [Streptomyces acidiscabies]
MSTPQRPPRPDEVLAFHNGDTLDDIPVVRVPSPRRLPWKPVAVGGAAAIALGAFAALLLHRPDAGRVTGAEASPRMTPSAQRVDSENTDTSSPGKVPSLAEKTTPTCLRVMYKTPGGTASCEPKEEICTPGAPWYLADIETLCGFSVPLQSIHVISQPATGGDPGSSYCLAWTGSSDGMGKDAALLMNAAGYQCGAYLVGGDGQSIQEDGTSVFSDTLQNCPDLYPGTRTTYPAVLDFPNEGGAQSPSYVCVMENSGA